MPSVAKIIQILLHYPDSASKNSLSMKNDENLDAKELLACIIHGIPFVQI